MRRAGLTLLEVVVSLFIFMIALTALWYLMQVGSDRAMDVKYQSMTSLKCQSKLTEVITGEAPLSSSGGYQPFPDAQEPYDKLEWKIDVDPGAAIGLYDVRVSVRTTTSTRVIETVLAQMVLDPKMRGSTQDRVSADDLPPTPTPTQDAPAAK